jgi:uncharacterized membrane protein
MWGKIIHNRLYLLVLAGAAFLVVTALGGGLFGQHGFWYEHWQHNAFRGLCHQDPQRAFWLGETPMAVCTRCFGIYAGFFAAWLAVPSGANWIKQLDRYIQLDRYLKVLLSAAVSLNVIDFLGNFIGLWHNTGESRFALGLLIGVMVALMIGDKLLKETRIKLNGIHYGTNTSGK